MDKSAVGVVAPGRVLRKRRWRQLLRPSSAVA